MDNYTKDNNTDNTDYNEDEINAYYKELNNLNTQKNFEQIESISFNLNQSALDFIEEGNLLLIKKCFLDAINSYNKAIVINPRFSKPYYCKAMAYYYLNQLDKAEEEWNKAFDAEWQK